MPGRGRKRVGKPPSAGAVGPSSGPIRQSQARSTEDNNDQPDPERMAADFERELVWCIQQLEVGLTSSKHKPDSRQAEDAVKLLKILQNPKAPVIKKRQVMRNTFGDYRKKMADEEKKHETAMKKMKLEAVQGDKSTFLKKASHTVTSDVPAEGSTKPQDMTSLMSNLSCTGGGEASFKFDFKPEETDNHDKDSGDNTNTQNAEGGKPDDNSQPPVENYYKMSITDNSFRFNFTTAETS